MVTNPSVTTERNAPAPLGLMVTRYYAHRQPVMPAQSSGHRSKSVCPNVVEREWQFAIFTSSASSSELYASDSDRVFTRRLHRTSMRGWLLMICVVLTRPIWQVGQLFSQQQDNVSDKSCLGQCLHCEWICRSEVLSFWLPVGELQTHRARSSSEPLVCMLGCV
jgi:hypothetical protein